MMRFYVAAPLTRLDDAKTVASVVRDAGFEVASTWHEGKPSPQKEMAMLPEELQLISLTCRAEIRACDVVLLLKVTRAERTKADRWGNTFEAGFAAALGKRIVTIDTCTMSTVPTALLYGVCELTQLTVDSLTPEDIRRLVSPPLASAPVPEDSMHGPGGVGC